MRVLVTGKEGQLVRSLLERSAAQPNLEIVAVGRPNLDLEDLDAVEPAIVACLPDVIINAAAYTAVDRAETEPELAALINAAAPRRIARTAARLGVPIIQVSTDYVFDGKSSEPYKEDDSVAPSSVYGQTKLSGEIAVAEETPNHVIARTAWVYSPYGKNFLKTMLRLGEIRSEVAVVDDQRGTPTSALDLADALLAMSRRLLFEPRNAKLRGVFHVSGTGAATWAEFARQIFLEAAKHGRQDVLVKPIGAAQYPMAATRPASSSLDCAKLFDEYGIRLQHWQTASAICVGRLVTEQSVSGCRSP